ncbi:bile acid:sodium symporter [Candidatus Uhrbacteria bacterium]|nr:bile acid:sodium symporter [Candidatus Uhrbacteria bacterium]
MLTFLTRSFRWLIESYLFIVVAAIAVGIFFSEPVSHLAPYTTLFLQVIFFLSSLKLETKEVVRGVKQWKTLVVTNAIILLILPTVVFLLTRGMDAETGFALTLLAAMPAGMTLPLMADVIGADRPLALLLTVSTSLLAPLTIPLILSALVGSEIELPFLSMVWRLFLVIVIPFACAQVVRRILKVGVANNAYLFKPVSLLLLGGLIAASVATNAPAISGSLPRLASALFLLVLFFLGIHLFAHLCFFWKPYKEQVTIAASVTFMNFTLAIYLANQYFPDPDIIILLVLSIIPWAILLVPLASLTEHLRKRGWVR